MLKKGFTLAETIIALGIIGVIVAITTPIVIHSTAKAQVGPKLAKTVAIFEQANAAILQTNNSNSMLAKYYKNNAFDYEKYSADLNNYLKSNITANNLRFVPAANAAKTGGNWFDCNVSLNPNCGTMDPDTSERRVWDVGGSYMIEEENSTTLPNTSGGTTSGGPSTNGDFFRDDTDLSNATYKCTEAWKENRYDAASCGVYCERNPNSPHLACKPCSQLEPGSDAYKIKKCKTKPQKNDCDARCLPGCFDKNGICTNNDPCKGLNPSSQAYKDNNCGYNDTPSTGGGTGGGDNNPPTVEDNGEQSQRPTLPTGEKLNSAIILPTDWAGLFAKDKSITLNNGISIAYEIKKDYVNAPSKLAPRKQRIGIVAIDINGIKNGKNEIAKDIFAFVMYNDGSLRPVGIYNWDGTQNDNLTWENECDIGSEGGNPYCTGAIFENKFKVKYKY